MPICNDGPQAFEKTRIKVDQSGLIQTVEMQSRRPRDGQFATLKLIPQNPFTGRPVRAKVRRNGEVL